MTISEERQRKIDAQNKLLSLGQEFLAATQGDMDALYTILHALERKIPKEEPYKSKYWRVHHPLAGVMQGILGDGELGHLPHLLKTNLDPYLFLRIDPTESQIEEELRPSPHIKAIREKLIGFVKRNPAVFASGPP